MQPGCSIMPINHQMHTYTRTPTCADHLKHTYTHLCQTKVLPAPSQIAATRSTTCVPLLQTGCEHVPPCTRALSCRLAAENPTRTDSVGRQSLSPHIDPQNCWQSAMTASNGYLLTSPVQPLRSLCPYRTSDQHDQQLTGITRFRCCSGEDSTCFF